MIVAHGLLLLLRLFAQPALFKGGKSFSQYKNVFTHRHCKVEQIFGVIAVQNVIGRVSGKVPVVLKFLAPFVQPLVDNLIAVELVNPSASINRSALPFV